MSFFRSLTAKLMVIYVPLVCISVVVVFSILEIRFVGDEKMRLVEKLGKLLEVESAALAIPAWEFDLSSIELLLNSMVHDEDFQYAKVTDPQGSVMARVGDETGRKASDLIVRTRDLVYRSGDVSETVGSITIAFHRDQIDVDLKKRLQADALILISLVAILLTVIWGTTTRVIGNPLSQLQNAIERAKSGETREPVKWNSADELGQVVRAYNEMQEAEAASAAEVAKYRDHLEALVRERTAELESSQNELSKKTDILQAVLGSIRQGLAAFDSDLKLIAWNDRYLDVRDYPKDMAETGRPFEDFIRYDVERNEFGADNPEQELNEQISRAQRFERHAFERERPNGRIIEIHGGPIPGGGFVSTYADITDRKIAERELKRVHNLITESIGYASRIQRSVLPSAGLLSERFSDHFIIWEPRDVVGGDMIWHRPCERGDLIIAADCTGHGVPGAFMTMIATGALDQALIEIPGGEPASLLQRMNQLIQGVLGQDTDEGESDDGLELGICLIDRVDGELTFAGARFFLWAVKDNDVREFKGDKKGIAYRHIPQTETFSSQIVQLEKGQAYYMFSDGMIDQIGGPKKRAFGKKRIQRLIVENCDQPMAKQKNSIYRGFAEYQGREERRDDITLIGFKTK